MNLDTWVDGCKVRATPWIYGKRIHFNVQYYAPGQSAAQPPVWDKTVYVTDNAAGQRMVYEFTDTLVKYVSALKIGNNIQANITVG